ncbi:uncharacterized protein LTR77_009551 [Saxophila tyrrhenica]|uniref:Btz domain-containing protein n=1 Tax=Saxophila tyrrhenica TaxID=1690608 RepID=A0AAV9P1V4_9PEZI|nr:hypothetical protein LTR77_009551 [Saxophila tyrrhenica]
MAAGRTLKSLVSRRRRAEDEGEDEEGPVFVEDSQSEGSVVTERDDDEEAEVGSVVANGAVQAGAVETPAGEVDTVNGVNSKKARKQSGENGSKATEGNDAVPAAQSKAGFKTVADTEAMMNGLKISAQGESGDAAVDFEEMAPSASSTAPVRTNGQGLPAAERQRREHEEYRKKRDSNPAFIPNRGNFFMHDTRGQNLGPAPPQRGGFAGRGRGRVEPDVGGPFSPANQMALAERASQQTWKHDLHDTINEEVTAPPAQAANSIPTAPRQQSNYSAHLFPKAPMHPNHAQPAGGQTTTSSFDSTTLLGTLQVRVKLPGMKAPAALAEAKARRYVRLPNHRPPLRRDKPVRVFVPGHTQRYIFPSAERSFVFIPRQMRPNQQGYHRGYQRSMGGYGYSSRRTSMHGSVYSNSVAASRRSSLAGVSRDRAFSPAGSFVGMPPGRPVVRLPHGSATSTPVGHMSGYHTPTGPTQLHTYPLPQMPQFQGTPTTALHQPRPQKAISVTGIESPAILGQSAGDAQPFHNQLPAHMNEQPAYQQPPPSQPYFSPQQYQYPPQPQAGTPLSGIPEQAMHAPNFQPPAYGQQPYYSPYPPQQGYYYPPPGPNGYPQMPMYMMPPPHQGYMLPAPGPPMHSQPPPPPPPQQDRPVSSTSEQQAQQSQSGMVAHESNGMVFYVPASEAQSSEQHYQPAEGFVPAYAMPGLPPPTPAPENQMPYYYNPMPHGDPGQGMCYPTQ